MKKQFIALISFVLMIFSFAGCSETDESNSLEASQSELSETKEIERKEKTGNIFMDSNLLEKPVLNGMRTERIGTYAEMNCPLESISNVNTEELAVFANEVVTGSDYNWVTINLEDGTAIIFTGSDVSTPLHAIPDEEGALSDDEIGMLTAGYGEDGNTVKNYTYETREQYAGQ